jgi:hemolysin activation/secretion protein
MKTSNKTLTRTAFSIALFQALTAMAAAPDAGQVIRELEQVSPTMPVVPQALVDSNVESSENDDVKTMVKSIGFNGNKAFSSSELQALVADFLGDERNFKALKDAAMRITRHYRQHGYAVARAYLPAQNIKDGVITINIIEGRIEKRNINNQSRISDERIHAFFDQVHEGDVVKSSQIDRSLMLLNTTPGVGSSRAVLQPGASVGTSDLLIELTPSAAYHGNVNIDNYGNRYTGEYRLGGTVYVNSPLKLGDQLTLSALTTGSNLNYGRVSYQVPVGSKGLRLGAALFETQYKLGKEFEKLDANGSATSGSVFALYPFIRTQQSSLTAVVTLEQKRLKDNVDSTNATTKKEVQLANFSIAGSYADVLGGDGVSGIDLSMIHGDLDIRSAGMLALDDVSAHTNGNYTRWIYRLNRLQRLTEANTLSLTVSGQESSKNLDSSEKFLLGGSNGVRAYPQGEGVGDEGWLASIELRHRFTPNLQASMFYDAGGVTFNRNRFDTSNDNHRHLAGAGVGVDAMVSGFLLKASAAWRTSGGGSNDYTKLCETYAYGVAANGQGILRIL